MTQVPPQEEGLPKRAKYAIGGFAGCLGLTCMICVSLFVAAAVPDAVGLALGVVAAAVPAIVYVLAVTWLDRYEREPISLLVGAFFWGSVVAVVLALILELAGSLAISAVAGADVADVALGVVGAPLIEEASKGLVLLLLFFLLKNEFDDTLDGIIYGSVVGLGFAMTENITYLGRQYIAGGVFALAQLFVIRVVLGGLAHALYTGTTGAGLGFARETANRTLKIVVPMGAFTLGVGQHLLWNGTLQALQGVLPDTGSFLTILVVATTMSVVLAGPAVVVLLVIVFLTWRRERQIIADYLASEAQPGVVTAEDYAVISSSWRRAQVLYSALFSRGLVYWYYLRKLYQAETELAFSKWHASQGERPRRRRLLMPEDHFRAQIKDIRARLGAM